MAEEKRRPSLHDHSSSLRTSSARDERPRYERPRASNDSREKKKPGDMKERHRGERVAMYQAHSSESHDMLGNQAEGSGKWRIAMKKQSRISRPSRSGK